jgi:hypothetical protein
MALSLEEVVQAVAQRGGGWNPRVTTNSLHSAEQARARTGVIFPPGYREAIAKQEPPHERTAGVAPTVFDWRDVGGASYVTPVRDQNPCGSCVAFGILAVLESMLRIEAQQPSLVVDLSETDLYNCFGKDHGAIPCPQGGWWPDDAWPGVQAGIVDEGCCPYDPSNQNCNKCSDASSRQTRAKTLFHVGNFDVATMKQHISTVGPLTACFDVYEDFYRFYGGGVYTYDAATSGDHVGGHCVAVVGYDETQNCWIAKNSWGTGWGEHGFFRIRMGDRTLGFDAAMWGCSGIESYLLGSSHLQVAGLVRGNVWHTIRDSDGSWQTAFGHVHGPNNDGQGDFTDVACAGAAGALHVVGLIQGNVWHTLRNADGSWQAAFGHVHGPNNDGVGDFNVIASAGVRDELHLVGLIKGNVWHTIRHRDGSWQAGFGHVHGPNNDGKGPFTQVSCAGVGDQLHVVGVVGGQPWHTIRYANASWQPWGAVDGPVRGRPGSFAFVGCAGTGMTLQVVGNYGGALWHTLRRGDGTWYPAWGSIAGVEHNNPGVFGSFGCAGLGNSLHVVGQVGGVPWHTMRNADGSWQPTFNAVPRVDGLPPLPVNIVKAGGT